MYKRIRAAGSAALLMLFFAACSGIPQISETAVKTETAVAEASEKEAAENEASETEAAENGSTETETAEEENTEESSSGQETEAERSHEGEKVSFGRYTAEMIAAVNMLTLETDGSGLYDVLSEAVFTEQQVREMIESYMLPERAMYGDRPADENVKNELLAYRNIENIPDAIVIRYGIITDNADVRSFPTELKASDTNADKDFDYFQESMFNIGEGVLILHQTADGEWSFVQGSNYYGWVRTDHIGFCTEEDFRSCLTSEYFLVSLNPENILEEKQIRIGTVLACSEDGTVLLPGRDEEGTLVLSEVTPDPEKVLKNTDEISSVLCYDYSVGFLPYSGTAVSEEMERLTGIPYGWGDTDGYYDCSSAIGLVYRCFGVYMPRNTSQMKYFGGGEENGSNVVSLEGLSAEEKYAAMSSAAGAVLVMPGHAMLYEGSGASGHLVVHANTGYYTADGTHEEPWAVVETPLESLHSADGTGFIDRITYLIHIE